MSDTTSNVDTIYTAWLKAQAQLLEAQAPMWNMIAGHVQSDMAKTLVSASEELWSQAERQAQEWVNLYSTSVGLAGGADGIVQETLQRMLDPGQLMFVGSDEVTQAIQKLVEGPEFADLGALKQQGLKATQEWMALRDAKAAYRMVTAKAWGRAFQKFTEEMTENPDLWKAEMRQTLDRWLGVVNDELISTQRTKEFLDAQSALLNAGVAYRLHERKAVEQWCEAYSIPTRTEVDELHQKVHELRREMRAVKKTAATQADAPRTAKARARASKATAPKRGASVAVEV